MCVWASILTGQQMPQRSIGRRTGSIFHPGGYGIDGSVPSLGQSSLEPSVRASWPKTGLGWRTDSIYLRKHTVR